MSELFENRKARDAEGLMADPTPGVLYHGTTQANWAKIKETGAIVGTAQHNWGASKDGSVYLTASQDDAREYVARAFGGGEDAVVLEIDASKLDRDALYVDPNEEYGEAEGGRYDVFSFEYRGEVPLSAAKVASPASAKGIDINPTGLDVESMTPVLEFATGNGYEYRYDPKKKRYVSKKVSPQGEGRITVEAGIGGGEIADIGLAEDSDGTRYLSIRTFSIEHVYNLKSFIETRPKFTDVMAYIGQETSCWKKPEKWFAGKIEGQVRVYADRTVSLVVKATTDSGVAYYVPTEEGLERWVALNGNRGWQKRYANACFSPTPSDPADRKRLEESQKAHKRLDCDFWYSEWGLDGAFGFVRYFKEVRTDAEVRAAARPGWTPEGALSLFVPFTLNTTAGKRVCSAPFSDGFEEGLKADLGGFFSGEADAFSGYRSKTDACFFQRKKSALTSRKPLGSDVIGDLCQLAAFLNIDPKAGKRAAKLTARADELGPTVHWASDEGVDATWERRGGLIICSSGDCAYVHDVAKRKGEIILRNEQRDGAVSYAKFRFSSPKSVVARICTAPAAPSSSGESTHRIIGGISPRELFDGTDVAWMIDHGVPAYDSCGWWGSPKEGDAMLPLAPSEAFTDGWICRQAILSLAAAGHHWAEKTLKAGYGALYAWMLIETAEGEGAIARVGKDETVAQAIGCGARGRRRSSFPRLLVWEKEGSLNKILRMATWQISMLNDRVKRGFEEFMAQDSGLRSWNISKIVCGWLPYCLPILGLEGYSSISKDVFGRILSMAERKYPGKDQFANSGLIEASVRSWGSECASQLSASYGVLSGKTAKGRFDVVEAYPYPAVYRDYLRMRDAFLSSIQDPLVRAGAEREYPTEPKAAKPFIPYLVGQRFADGWNATRVVACEDDFLMAFRRIEHKSKELFRDQRTNALLGVSLTLTANQHMKLLHDRLSVELSAISDQLSEERFEKVAEAIKPLEWEDDSQGLSIVVPDKGDDLRREGATLHHCVGSYVDAMSNGTDFVLFVRRKGMEKEPYFTLDMLPDGTIRQVHCHANGSASAEGIMRAFEETGREVYREPKDVVGFLKKWISAMKGIQSPLKPKALGVSINGAYCAKM